MTDQTSEHGHDKNGAGQTETSPLTTRSPPVIEGEAVEIPAEQPKLLDATTPQESASPEADKSVSEAPAGSADGVVHHEGVAEEAKPESEAPVEESAAEPGSVTPQARSRNSFLAPVVGLVVAVLIGGGGYVAWQQYEAVYHESPLQFGESAKPGAATPEAPPPVDTAKNEAESAPPAAKSEGATPDAGKAEPATPDSAAPAPVSPPPTALKEPEPNVSPAPDSEGKVATNSPPAAAPEAAAGPSSAELSDQLAQTRAQLRGLQQRLAGDEAKLAAPNSDTQAQVDGLQHRLDAAEAKLAAPKAESRAQEAPDAAPARSADAAARLVLAQSLLTALHQDVDFAPLIGVLEKLGADPQNVAQLRAGLAAPGPAKLTVELSGLSDKIIAAAAPPSPQNADQNTANDTSKNFGAKALAFLQSRAEKIIKVRAAGSAQDLAAGHVAQAIKDLSIGDLAGAVAEQEQLPEPARAVSADWARAAKARLDAEAAAKAEVAAALQNLSNSKI